MKFQSFPLICAVRQLRLLPVCFLLLLAGVASPAWATDYGEVVFSNRIYGADIASGHILRIRDDLFPANVMNGAGWDAGLDIRKAELRVLLGIDRQTLATTAADVSIQATVRITGYRADLTSSQVTATLNINYDGDQTGELEQVYDLEVLNGIHEAEIQVIGLTVNGAAVSPDYAYLEAQLMVNRSRSDWDARWNTIDDNWEAEHAFQVEHDQLEVRWEFIEGADEYELEWTYVYEVDGQTVDASSYQDLRYDFRHNASRIQTGANHYRIPLHYEAGILIYRIRAVHYVHAGGLTHRIPSEWSSTQFGAGLEDAGVLKFLIDDFPLTGNQFTFRPTLEESWRNWQVSVTYAEEG